MQSADESETRFTVPGSLRKTFYQDKMFMFITISSESERGWGCLLQLKLWSGELKIVRTEF